MWPTSSELSKVFVSFYREIISSPKTPAVVVHVTLTHMFGAMAALNEHAFGELLNHRPRRKEIVNVEFKKWIAVERSRLQFFPRAPSLISPLISTIPTFTRAENNRGCHLRNLDFDQNGSNRVGSSWDEESSKKEIFHIII